MKVVGVWLLLFLGVVQPLSLAVPNSLARPNCKSLSRCMHMSAANRAYTSMNVDSGDSTDGGKGPVNSKFAVRSVVLALSYSTISAAWYLGGMTMFLFGATSSVPFISAPIGCHPLRLACTRLSTAWVVTFAASQITTPWRAAGAVGFAPAINRILVTLCRGDRSRMTPRGVILPALAYVFLLAAVFSGGIAALGAREMALAAALRA